MKTTTRIPQPPAEPIPERAQFPALFRGPCARSQGPHALARSLTGLFTEHLPKNGDPRAQVVPSTSEQSLPGPLTALNWDPHDRHRQHVQALLTLPTQGAGVLVTVHPVGSKSAERRSGSSMRRRRTV